MRRSRRPTIEPLENRVLLARPLGIDVSDYQPTINWTSVKNAGYTFAWTKATEGVTFNATTYTSHINGANAAGVLIGPYHYARYDNNSASAEVTHFLNIAGGQIGAGYLPPMLDVEAPNNPLTKAQTSQWVNDWCNGILAATGIRPIVYTYISYASSYLDSSVTQWPLWMANYNGQNPQTGGPNATAPWSTWTFWQNNDTSGNPNVPGDVDVFNGTPTTLNSWIIPAAPTSPSPANNAQVTGSPATLDWADVTNATNYDVYVDSVLKANVAISQWTVNPALANGAHAWQIKAKNNAGTVPGPTWNFTVNPAVSLNAPTNMAVTGATDTTVSLSWTDMSTGEQSYLVERKAGAGGTYAQIANIAANSAAYTDNNASPGTTYYYRVRVYGGGTTYGPYGSEVSTTTYASVPQNVAASDGSFTTKVHLDWDLAGGAVSYQLYRSTTNNPATAGLLAPSSTNSYDDTGAVPGTTYYYWVASRDILNRLSAKSSGDAGSRAVDSTPPTVLSDDFDYTAMDQPVVFTFSEDVSASIDPSNLTVIKLDDQSSIGVANVVYDSNTNTATYSLAAPLADANYRATLTGSSISDAQGNPLGANVILDFFFLTADANHDGTVDTTDFNLLAANFGQSGKTYTQGDFNYDGAVDTTDFNILAGKFGTTLATSGARSASTPLAVLHPFSFSIVPIFQDATVDSFLNLQETPLI